MLPKQVSINNIHVFLGTQCRKFRAKKFPVFSNFSNKISEYQISIGVRPQLTGFQLIGELFLDVVIPNTDNRAPTVLFFCHINH